MQRSLFVFHEVVCLALETLNEMHDLWPFYLKDSDKKLGIFKEYQASVVDLSSVLCLSLNGCLEKDCSKSFQ